MTKLRALLLVALAVVAAAALRLSGRPIMETARGLDVPDDGSLWTAVVMVEGAQLILTALWLHPGTSRPVRAMAAFGTVGCLLLSAGAGWSVYGPVGMVPALLYAGLVHILSRDLLAGSTAGKSRESAGDVANPHVVAMDELANRPGMSRDGWGGPEAVTTPTRSTPESTPAPTPRPRPTVVRSPASTSTSAAKVEHAPGWREDMAPAKAGQDTTKWVRARAQVHGIPYSGATKMRPLRLQVEAAEVAAAGQAAGNAGVAREVVPA